MSTIIRVGPQRFVAMRYIMKNATGEVLANIMEHKPVTFKFGSGEILPGLEQPLKGLKIGDKKSFCLSPESCPGLDQILYFDVVIDDIRGGNKTGHRDTASPEDLGSCGPGCDC